MRKVAGVAEVNAWGGYVRQYHVVLSPEALLKFNLTMDDVFEALQKNNDNVGGGLTTASGISQMVHGIGRVELHGLGRNVCQGTDSLEPLVVAVVRPAPVRLGIVPPFVVGSLALAPTLPTPGCLEFLFFPLPAHLRSRPR